MTSSDIESDLPALEATPLSPKVDRIRHHLIPARTNTCVRAPCLKRQASVPVSKITSDLAATRLEGNPTQDRVASNPLPTSFAAPRNLVLQANLRHVHFDEAPPEEFSVLSGASYDRRPIKCTRGGSEFDMSLPPRSSSYNGDETSEEEASSIDESLTAMESAEEPAPDVGFFQDPSLENWACIKNGTVIASVGYQPRQQQSGLMASGKSLHFSALSSLQHASALNGGDAPSSNEASQPQATSQKVSLPVHGFRSFGGLQNSLAPEVTAPAPAEPQPASQHKDLSSPATPPTTRKFSPDATPMPSPSLHKSMGSFASANYFAAASDDSSSSIADRSHSKDAPSSDTATKENALGVVEVLRDTAVSASSPVRQPSPLREPAQAETGRSSPLSGKPNSISIQVPDAAARSAPRRLGLERRMAEKDAARISGLQPPSPLNGSGGASSPGWSGLLGVTSSPLSSRCSSVDPWSSLSSDGDADGIESPGNENSWISSNCTSPDLSAFEQMTADSLHHEAGLRSTAESRPTWMRPNGSAPNRVKVTAEATDDWNQELNTPKTTGFADEARFSSSVETVNTVNWEPKHFAGMPSSSRLAVVSNGEISTSEATTPESSRRPSLRYNDTDSQRLSPKIRTSFEDHEDSAMDNRDDDDPRAIRVRSLSRDGHVKKKSTKCRYCRSLRQRLKDSGTESSAPTSSGGSAQITDAEEEGETKTERSALGMLSPQLARKLDGGDLPGSNEVSEMEDEGQRLRSSLSPLRASVRSLSVEGRSSSRSRSRDGSAFSLLSVARDSQHERESSNSPGESCSESPHLLAVNVPTMCTCDKKREKERLKKKVRKEREMERERDREWERDQARGRQKKLFGEGFGDADTSLSALDGF
uniref:Uncharacterized protein n=1 Tax=Kalmanozyma brasiliensis (strain GHG001) TaxID=1365824 RepID=V5E431_KALBG